MQIFSTADNLYEMSSPIKNEKKDISKYHLLQFVTNILSTSAVWAEKCAGPRSLVDKRVDS